MLKLRDFFAFVEPQALILTVLNLFRILVNLINHKCVTV